MAHSPMFPERPVPELPSSLSDKGVGAAVSSEADFLTRHGGKVAAVALSVAFGLIYTYYESIQSKNRVEEELNADAALEPYEINEIRFLNTMTPEVFDSLVAACMEHFEGGVATYADFVAFVGAFLGRYNAAVVSAAKHAPSSSSSVAAAAAAAPRPNEPFIPSAAFVGRKDGYAFRTGPEGLGYYLDAPLLRPKQPLAPSRASAESTVPGTVHVRAGHLFDRLVASYLQQQHKQRRTDNNSSGNSHGGGDQSIQGDAPSLATTPLPVGFLLVALNMAERTAAPQRVDSLFRLASLFDTGSSSSSGGGSRSSSSSSSSYEDNAVPTVSAAAAEAVVRHLGDSWQLPAEKRIAETGVRFPVKTYRRKTAEDAVRAFLDKRAKDAAELARKEGRVHVPGPDDNAFNRDAFEQLLLGGYVCTWAECYRTP